MQMKPNPTVQKQEDVQVRFEQVDPKKETQHKVSREEKKKSQKILKNKFLQGFQKEMEDEPEEIIKDQTPDFLKKTGELEETYYFRKQLTKKDKKALSLHKQKQMQNPLADFTQLNDLKHTFGERQEKTKEKGKVRREKGIRKQKKSKRPKFKR